MCNFFSFAWDGGSNFLYSDWEIRKQFKAVENCDSHTFILTHFGIAPKKQENWSTYEYNPLTGKLTVGTSVRGHDVSVAEAWVRQLDFKKIVPALIIKEIKNPLTGKAKKVTEKDIECLKQWINIEASVWDSVWVSVGDSVWDSVWVSVRASVRASVWDFVRDSVGDSVWDSVGASVWAFVRASVRDSVWAYIFSFFDIKYEEDFSCLPTLWDRGFVPSFDGTTWRLHSGKNAEIVYEI